MRKRHFGALMSCMSRFGGMLLFRVLVSVAGRAQRHEDERQEGEDKRLDEANEQFEEVERNGTDERHQERDDEQQHVAGEQVAKKTEAERQDAQRFKNQFQ